jgi:hypothetical protein
MKTWLIRFSPRITLSLACLLVCLLIEGGMSLHHQAAAQPQIITWISQFWKRSRKPLGVRGALCPISPGIIESLQVFHDRPTFVWSNGDVIEVNLRRRGETEPFWQGKPSQGDRAIRYDGLEPLKPGLYQWQIIAPDPKTGKAPEAKSSDRQVWKSFGVMAPEQRGEMQRQLQAFHDDLKKQKYSNEEIALQTADFFADRKLWSDAIQILFSVSNPSLQFLEERQKYLQQLCTETNSA